MEIEARTCRRRRVRAGGGGAKRRPGGGGGGGTGTHAPASRSRSGERRRPPTGARGKRSGCNDSVVDLGVEAARSALGWRSARSRSPSTSTWRFGARAQGRTSASRALSTRTRRAEITQGGDSESDARKHGCGHVKDAALKLRGHAANHRRRHRDHAYRGENARPTSAAGRRHSPDRHAARPHEVLVATRHHGLGGIT